VFSSADASDTSAVSAAPAPTVTVTVTVTAETTAAEGPSEEPSDAATPSEEPTKKTQVGGDGSGDVEDTFVMPDETGKTLQAAQDDLQAVSGNPFFYSSSEDATGDGRGQWVDSGWQVCSQNHDAGTEVSADDEHIVFSVVRTSEDCP
jgi:hypothetical protein